MFLSDIGVSMSLIWFRIIVNSVGFDLIWYIRCECAEGSKFVDLNWIQSYSFELLSCSVILLSRKSKRVLEYEINLLVIYIYLFIFFFIENVNIGINWVFSTNVDAPGREFSGYCSATSRRCCWRRNGLWMEWWWWFTWVESTKGIDWSHRGSDCRFSACVVHAKHNECWTARNAQTFGARKHDYVISHQCLVLETVHYVLHFMVGDLES